MIHASAWLHDVSAPPGNGLERLNGNRKAHYSIRVDDRWRIAFRWSGGHAHEVRIVD